MRYQGKVVQWDSARGFGFVCRNGDDTRVFLHISAITGRRQPPQVGDVLTWRQQTDPRGRPQAVEAAYVVSLADTVPPATTVRPATRRQHRSRPARKSHVPAVVAGVLAAVVAGAGWVYWQQARTGSDALPAAVQMSADSPLRTPVAAAPRFTCSGNTRCGQMRSCDEAKFYLNHCPGTITDGDGDGIPCEDQWCGH